MNCNTKITLQKIKMIKGLISHISTLKRLKLNAGTRSEEIRLTVEIARHEAKIEAIEEFTRVIL